MPLPTFTGLPPEPTFQDLVTKFNKLTKEMQNLFLTLDSMNVISLTADHIDTGTLLAALVTIKGALNSGGYITIDGNGMTVNNGTKNVMRIDLDGNITVEDGVITGGTVRTASSGKRIELSGNQLRTYDDDNNLEGMVLGPNEFGHVYGDVFFYFNGTKVMEFYNTLADGYIIRGVGSNPLGLGSGSTSVICRGTWDFNLASVSNLSGIPQSAITSLESRLADIESRLTALETAP